MEEGLIHEETKCQACFKQCEALKKLWSQIPNRASPTEFNWHCYVCGEDRRLKVD